MAGARVEIQVDDKRVIDAVQRLQASLDADGFRVALADIGEYLLRSTRERAAGEAGPDGEPWPALSPRYARRKEKQRPNAPLLVFDRHMLGDRLAYQIEDDTLYVGTSAPYGARQQFGGGGIPPRPWLGVSQEDENEIRQITLDYLQSAVEGGESPAA